MTRGSSIVVGGWYGIWAGIEIGSGDSVIRLFESVGPLFSMKRH